MLGGGDSLNLRDRRRLGPWERLENVSNRVSGVGLDLHTRGLPEPLEVQETLKDAEGIVIGKSEHLY